MPEYELTFELSPMTDEVQEQVIDEFDAVLAEHQGVTSATLTVEGRDCVSAARKAMDTLEQFGVAVSRLIDDLVGKAQIADRLGVSRQAVGLWTSGQRQVTTVFPAPFLTLGGGLWRWAEVVQFVRSAGYVVDDIELPTRREVQLIGGILAARTDSANGALVTAMIERLAVTTSDSMTNAYSVRAAAHARLTDFSLAA